MVVNGTKRIVKRRVTADLRDFLVFPSDDGEYINEPFRKAVRGLLTTHAILPPPSSLLPHLLTWQVIFRVGDVVADDGGLAIVCLDVVEEDVARSRSVYCDQCRVVGWSNNPVSAKRYHFIIKADGNSIAGYNKTCAGCGDTLHMSDSRCKSCNYVMTAEDVEDWMYQQLENTTHLLHGVVHANGYGHLLRVNGREGGSSLLSGHQIMNFWDQICDMLGIRKVSVLDVSKKKGLDFRLLHAVIKGHPWYGEWGYHFGAGSFSLTHDDYKIAVNSLSSLPLSSFQSQGRKIRTHLQDMIEFYQSMSERKLVNIRDIFCFLLSLIREKHYTPNGSDGSPRKKLKTGDSGALCSWGISDINHVEEAMFKVLRAVTGSTWVSLRALRGAVCRSGSPELLDYCLKELNGKLAAPGMVVNTRCVSDSGAMEYRLEPGSAPLQPNNPLNAGFPILNHLSEDRLWLDLQYFYECMLRPQTMVHHVSPSKRSLAICSASNILDCKQCVKDYQPEYSLTTSPGNSIQLVCEVDLMEEYDDEYYPNPPTELLILSPNATISDLKQEATRAFREAYLMFRRFQVEELVGYSGVDESTQIKLLLGSTQSVQVKGHFLGKIAFARYRMERGLERWTVDCSCGARDDDGERMLACDVCSVWQHTRCYGIPDSDAVPSKFYCPKCSRAGRLGRECGGEELEEVMVTKLEGGLIIPGVL